MILLSLQQFISGGGVAIDIARLAALMASQISKSLLVGKNIFNKISQGTGPVVAMGISKLCPFFDDNAHTNDCRKKLRCLP